MIYIGKIFVDDESQNDEKDTVLKLFMVRRKLHLEIVYTNGNIYWKERVNKSEINPPYYIQDMIMS